MTLTRRASAAFFVLGALVAGVGCTTTGYRPELVGETWRCPLEQVTAVHLGEQCVDRQLAEREPNALEIVLGIEPEPFIPDDAPSTTAPRGAVSIWDDDTCRAIYDVRGCGYHRAALCAEDGRCWFFSRLRSFATSDAECAAAPRCGTFGECFLATLHLPVGHAARVEGKCVAHDDASCAASTEACGIMGRCTFVNDPVRGRVERRLRPWQLVYRSRALPGAGRNLPRQHRSRLPRLA